jgi:hypothetical protein
MKCINIYFIFACLLFFACSHPPRQEYPYISGSLSQIGLSCNDTFALDAAEKAVLRQYPKLEKKLKNNHFSIFRSWYGGDAGKMKHTYSLKAIFNYYSIGNPSEGKYFEESIEVRMTKNCEVDDVIYLRDTLQVTY